MPSVTQVIEMRQRRRTAARRKPAARVGLGLSGLLSLLLAGLGFLAALAFADLTRDLPSVELLPTLLEPPNGELLNPTRLFDRTGAHELAAIENPATVGRQYLYLSGGSPQVSTSVISATLATADPTFWQNPGFSFAGLLQDGHPTLAQHLVSDLLLVDEPSSLRRALRERILAAELTRHSGRAKVLEWYLNSTDYGRLAYGVDAAARLYLGKSANDLTIAEAALLAAAAQSPGLNPLDDPKSALDRQKGAIQAMLRYQLILPEEGIQAVREELKLRTYQTPDEPYRLSTPQPGLDPAFFSLVMSQLELSFDRDRIDRGGLRVITPLDWDLQMQIDCVAALQLARLEVGQQTSIENGIDCPAAQLLPALPFKASLPVGSLQADVGIIDPRSGQVLALVSKPSPAVDAQPLRPHPAGTLAIPFIYLTAFTRGLGPATLVWDVPPQGSRPLIENFDGRFHGPVRLRIAMANDYLLPAQSLIDQIGINTIWHTALQTGIVGRDPLLEPGTSPLDLLGEVDLFQVSQSLGSLANQGVQAGRDLASASSASSETLDRSDLHPVALLRVEDASGGQTLLDWSAVQTRSILTPQLAFLMTDVLSDDQSRWPSLGHPNPLEIGRPAAAILGRSADAESNWAVGYTPQFVISAWIGLGSHQTDQPIDAEIGRQLPGATAGLWHAVAQVAHQGLPILTWSAPPGVSFLEVCDPSGLLPTPACPNTVQEVFQTENEPVHSDDLFQEVMVNRQTGRLATVFTPLDLVDAKVFMVPPPEFKSWVSRAGTPLSPEVYDVIPSTYPTWPDAAITAPTMFSEIHGKVMISGTAGSSTGGGRGGSSYRLQVGQGLNPQSWLQVGEDSSQGVLNGQLGVWDTSGLDGLYAIQLLVIHTDQSVHRNTVLVTVDNKPPLISLDYPLNGMQISAAERSSLIFQVSAQDDLSLQQVELFLDGRHLGTFTQPPFALSWNLTPGQHTLVVRASDQAGNISETSIDFTVVA